MLMLKYIKDVFW